MRHPWLPAYLLIVSAATAAQPETASAITASIVQPQQQPHTVVNPLAALALFSQGAALTPGLVHQLLGTAIEANMQIPPEFLGVKFWDTHTGTEFNREEIRALAGVGNHAAMLQIWETIEQLMPGKLPLSGAQLADITDAAYIASLTQPPATLSIEYYDIRTGATGIGGGVISPFLTGFKSRD